MCSKGASNGCEKGPGECAVDRCAERRASLGTNLRRDLADVFGIQSEIAEAIAQQLKAHLSAHEKEQMAKPSTNDPVAYDLYLRARQLDRSNQ